MSNKANTAIICLSPYYGGMEMDAIRFARLLSDSVNITLIAKRGAQIDKHYGPHAQDENVTFETINFLSNFSFSIIFGIRNIVKKYAIKNIIFFGASELRSLYFSFYKQNINLIIRHGTTKSHPKKDLLHRIIYRDVNWHIPICNHIADNVSFIIPFGEKTKMKVIYPSLRYEKCITQKPSITNTDELKLLHISRVAKGKGHADAIIACQSLYDKNISFKFMCVGEIDPDFYRQIERTIITKPYYTSIKFLGFKKNVEDYYQDANIFIFPSSGEGLSNSFIEALAHGLVCISYSNTSFPELKQLGFEFFMAEDGNIESLKSCLLGAVDYLKTRETPILHNIQLAQKLFNKAREHDELLDILV